MQFKLKKKIVFSSKKIRTKLLYKDFATRIVIVAMSLVSLVMLPLAVKGRIQMLEMFWIGKSAVELHPQFSSMARPINVMPTSPAQIYDVLFLLNSRLALMTCVHVLCCPWRLFRTNHDTMACPTFFFFALLSRKKLQSSRIFLNDFIEINLVSLHRLQVRWKPQTVRSFLSWLSLAFRSAIWPCIRHKVCPCNGITDRIIIVFAATAAKNGITICWARAWISGWVIWHIGLFYLRLLRHWHF